MADLDVIIDQYSPLNHKVGMGDEEGGPAAVADWVIDPQDRRRLNAYRRLAAILETVGREFMAENANRPDLANEWREYGDPRIFTNQIAYAIHGDGATVGIVGADRAVPEAPDIPPAPAPPSEDLEGVEAQVAKRIYDTAVRIWGDRATTITEEWEAEVDELPARKEREGWLADWADKEHFFPKLLELETEDIVPLGDGVVVLGWDPDKLRPTMEIFEGDAYFPVLDDSVMSSYPNKVHLAWGFVVVDDDGQEEEFVRRITYELVPLTPSEADEEAVEEPSEPGPYGTGDLPRYLEDGESATHVCLYSNEVFALEDVQEVGIYRVEGPDRFELVRDPASDGYIEAEKIPLGLDFLPVVHIPNDLSSRKHFGRSSLLNVVQLLDDLAAADTDESFAAELAARPSFVLTGTDPSDDPVTAVPGIGWKAREQGGVQVLDLTTALPKLRERIEGMLERLNVNIQVPGTLIGRADTLQAQSGFQVALSFTPFQQLIGRARSAREHKLALLLKMVQRIAIQNSPEALPGGTDTAMPAEVRFGSFMPADIQYMANVLEMLFRNRMLSQETILLILQEMGLPIDDVRSELASIRSVMGEEANYQTLATGDPNLAADLLGKRLSIEVNPEVADTGPAGQREDSEPRDSQSRSDAGERPTRSQPSTTTNAQAQARTRQ